LILKSILKNFIFFYYFKLSFSKFASDLQNTQFQAQNSNTQKINSSNPNLNHWIFLGAYVCFNPTERLTDRRKERRTAKQPTNIARTLQPGSRNTGTSLGYVTNLKQLALFLHGLEPHAFMTVWQFLPVKPGLHVQLNEPSIFLAHTASFWHGFSTAVHLCANWHL